MLIRLRTQLVTLKYTQYGGEGYLRDGFEEFFVRENSFTDSRGGQGRPPFFFFVTGSEIFICEGRRFASRRVEPGLTSLLLLSRASSRYEWQLNLGLEFDLAHPFRFCKNLRGDLSGRVLS